MRIRGLLLLATATAVEYTEHADRMYRTQFLAASTPMTTTIAGRAPDQDMGAEGDSAPWGSFAYYGADFFDENLGGPPPPYGSIMDGIGTNSKFRRPVDLSGSCSDFPSCDLYVVDSSDHKVRKLWVNQDREYATQTIAGDGRPAFMDHPDGQSASFNTPSGIVVDGNGSIAYVADRGNDRIRAVDLTTGEVTTIAGHNGVIGRYVRIHKLHDGTGLQVMDVQAFSHSGQRYIATGATMSTGDPSGCGDGDIDTKCETDQGQQLDYQIQIDFGQQRDISKILVYTQASISVFGGAGDTTMVNAVVSICPNSTWSCVWEQTVVDAKILHEFHPFVDGGTHDNNIGTEATFNKPTGLVLSPDQRTLFVSEQGVVGHVIRRVDVTGNRSVSILAGNVPGTWEGVGTYARFNNPAGLVLDPDDADVLYVADSGNHQIRRVQISTAQTASYAGHYSHGWDYADGFGTAAKFGMPHGLAIHTIDKCDGTRDKQMFIAEQGNHRIRAVNMETMQVSTVAGMEYSGQRDAGAFRAQFYMPSGLQVAFAGGGNRLIYVADSSNHAIRKTTVTVTMPTCADLQVHATLSASPVVPVGGPIIVTLNLETSADGGSPGTAINDWVGLFRSGECADADATDETTLSNLHRCQVAWKQISVEGLTSMEFVFSKDDYQVGGMYEARYFTQRSGPNTQAGGIVCGAAMGKSGRVSSDDRQLCWLDAYATSPVIEVSANMYSNRAAPDRSPFNGIRRDTLEKMYPGIDFDSLATPY